MIRISDALANGLLQGSSVKELLDGGFLRIFAGPVPATADEALDMTATTGDHTQLVQLAADAVPADAGVVGLNFAATASARALAKDAAETWVGKVHFVGKDAASAGVSPLTATFYRFCDAADDGTGVAGVGDPRIQGTVAEVGGDIVLDSVILSDNGANTVGLSSYEVRFPA